MLAWIDLKLPENTITPKGLWQRRKSNYMVQYLKTTFSELCWNYIVNIQRQIVTPLNNKLRFTFTLIYFHSVLLIAMKFEFSCYMPRFF